MTTLPTPYWPYHLVSDLSRSLLADTPVTRRALADWRQSRQTFNRLLSLAPSVRQVLNDLLRDVFASDPEHTGLLLNTGNVAHFVSLTQLGLFAHQQPSAPADLDARATVQGKHGVNPKVTELRPSELYARLVALDLQATLRQRWHDYWTARAEGTALSRREHARGQYRAHFMATLEIALEQQILAEEHRQPLVGLLENPEWRIHRQKKVLIQAPSSQPGALVISLEGDSPQVLYAPRQTSPFTAYATRETLESALRATEQDTITYTDLDGIGLGFDALFKHLEATLMNTLAAPAGAQLETHAANSLAAADLVEHAWRDSQVFAPAPEGDELAQPLSARPSLFDFGNLSLDLAPALRTQLIAGQLEMLDALPAAQLQQCQRQQAALLTARNTTQALVDAVTASAKWHSDAHPVTASTALVDAHRDGLLAHAQLQHALGQLDERQLNWVRTLFTASASDAVAAQVELVPQASAASIEQPSATLLLGALAITAKTLLDTPDTAHGLLLYWFGEHGGLLFCQSLQQLEGCLSAGLSVRLKALPDDPIGHTLNDLLAASRQQKDNLQASQGLPAAAQALPRLKEALALNLQVPRHAARETALRMHQAQQDILTQVGNALAGLTKIPAHDRQPLRTLVQDYLASLRKAQALIRRDLPERRQFCLARLAKRLKQDFDGFAEHRIELDIPVSTTYSGKDLIAGSGAPGTPFKAVLKASDERVTVALETLLLENIDDTMHDRLRFLRLRLEPADAALEQTLQAGLDAAYLRTLAHELDLAGQYEAAITQAFLGTDEGDHAQAFRRECLVAPHRLILRLQNLLFHASGHLDSASHAMLAQVIDAHSRADLQANGLDLRLLPARLTSGGPDTDGQPTTLAGVTFIEDRTHQSTLLYRPDHPSSPLRQFPTLEQARLSLFEGSVDSRERDYLASRALQGNPAAHRSRLDQAHANRFDGIIGVGVEWPATQSLAELQLDTHMGQLLQAHRGTSRSNLDLHVENLAAQAGKVLLGFKLALGLIPVLGLPVSLYDLYDASAGLIRALAAGNSVDVLDAIEQVLVSVVDIAMDALGGGVGTAAVGLRRSVRHYQLAQRPGSATASPRPWGTGHEPLAGLTGYQASEPVSLQGLPVAGTGRYQGIYRHTQGDYIEVQGHPYKVRWDEASHTWELSGNSGSAFKRAIALDENGQWNTHLALYGVHRLGAGAGGGQTLGRLADTLDPLWPAAVRERLPRWWRDQAYRRHNRLRDSINRDMPAFKDRTDALNQRMKRSFAVQDASDASLVGELQACIAEAKRIHADCLSFVEVSSARLRNNAQAQANDLAMLICDSHNRLGQMTQMRLAQTLDEVDRLRQVAREKANGLGGDLNAAQLMAATEEVLVFRVQMAEQRGKALAELDDLRRQVQAMRTWRRQVRQTAARREVFSHIDSELSNFTDHLLNYLDIAQLLGLLTKPVRSLDGAWLNLQYLMREPRADLDRALYAVHALGNARTSARQRGAILARSIDQMRQFKSRLGYWKTSYGEHFDAAQVQRLESTLDAYTQYARSLQQGTSQPQPVNRPGQRQPRVFETVQTHYLIGEADPHQPNTYRITGVNGRTEIYRQDASGKFTLTNPDTGAAATVRQATLDELRGEAGRHLDGLQAFTQKIEQYAAQGMDGASLEDLMRFKANDLEGLANRIARAAQSEPTLTRLDMASRNLIERGRTLRIEQIMKTREPNGAQLDYLVDQDVLLIEKTGTLVELKRTPDGRPDHLQEFRISDKRHAAPRTLWYAHVHFNKADPVFTDFIKAHLKTPAQRYLGSEWQASHVESIWRGDLNRAQALKHLAPHF